MYTTTRVLGHCTSFNDKQSRSKKQPRYTRRFEDKKSEPIMLSDAFG